MKGKESGQYGKDFPSRLRLLLNESGTNQNKLAEAIGKTRQTISLYCGGQAKPDIDALLIIAKFFGVTTDWLLGVPGAPKEINADKYQVMKTTGLSEMAVDILLENSAKHHEALETLLCIDDFTTAMYDIETAIEYSDSYNSFEYYLIPAYLGFVEDGEDAPHTIDEIKDDLLRMKCKYPAIIQINEYVDYLISDAFKLLERQYKETIIKNIYSLLHEASAVEMEELKHGNDNPTEE